MIVNYFNNTKPVNFIFLSVILVFLVLLSFYFNKSDLFTITQITKTAILLFTFFIFIYTSKDKLLSSKTDFGMFFYVLISGFFIESFIDLNKIISTFIIILALKQLLDLKKKKVKAKEKLFNNGLLLGVATLFYPLSFVFLLLTFIAILVFNKINWRMFIIPVIGFILPLLFSFVLKDVFEISLFNDLVFETSFGAPIIVNNIISYIIIGFLFFLLIWSLLSISVNLTSKLINYKDYHILIVLYLILAFFLMIFSPNKDGSEMICIVFPLSVLLAHLIPLIQKKRISNFIIYTLILLLVLQFLTKSQITSIT